MSAISEWVTWAFGFTGQTQPAKQSTVQEIEISTAPVDLPAQMAKLDAIFDRHRVWNDDLSLALHAWWNDVTEMEIEADLHHTPQDRLREQRMLQVDRLMRDILVDPIGKAGPMAEPMIDRRLDASGVDQGWVWEKSTAQEYQVLASTCVSPFDQKEMHLKPHLFAKAMLAWMGETVALPKRPAVDRDLKWFLVEIPQAITQRYQRQLDRQVETMRSDLIGFKRQFTQYLDRAEARANRRMDTHEERTSERLSEAEQAHKRQVEGVMREIERVEREWQTIKPALHQAMARSQAQDTEIQRIKTECERLARELRQIR